MGREPEANRRNTEELFGLFEKGKIKPLVSSSYPLAEGGKAILELAERRARGKVVVLP